jgi:hypothetical protein
MVAQREDSLRLAHGRDLRVEHALSVLVTLLAGQLETRRVDVVAQEDNDRPLGAHLADPLPGLTLERLEYRVDECVEDTGLRLGKLRRAGIPDEEDGTPDGGLRLADQGRLEVRVDVVLAGGERRSEGERGDERGDVRATKTAARAGVCHGPAIIAKTDGAVKKDKRIGRIDVCSHATFRSLRRSLGPGYLECFRVDSPFRRCSIQRISIATRRRSRTASRSARAIRLSHREIRRRTSTAPPMVTQREKWHEASRLHC